MNRNINIFQNINSGYFFLFLTLSIFTANYLFIDVNNDMIQRQIAEFSITQEIYSFIKIIVIITQVASTIVSTIIIAYISSLIAYHKFNLEIRVSLFFKIVTIVQSVQLLEAIISKVGESVYQTFESSLGVLIFSLQLFIIYYLTKQLFNNRRFTFSLLSVYGLFFLLGKSFTYFLR
jgi:hypothetical protein